MSNPTRAEGKTFNPTALRVVMARRHVTAPELAAMLHKKTSKVCKYLLGINEPSQQELGRISDVLEWPIGFFTRHDVFWPEWHTFGGVPHE